MAKTLDGVGGYVYFRKSEDGVWMVEGVGYDAHLKDDVDGDVRYKNAYKFGAPRAVTAEELGDGSAGTLKAMLDACDQACEDANGII